MDSFVDLLVEIWRADHGLAVVLVLAAIGFISTTVLLVSKIVGGAIASSRQVHTWLRDSGRLTPSDVATPELRAESPALVNLLVTRGKLSRDAVRATVLDLAARGQITLHQPGNDPAQTTLAVAGRAAPESLTAYERRVLDALPLRGIRVPLVTLPILQPGGMRRWHRQFRAEVQAEARSRGLTFLDTSILGRTVAATYVPCAVGGFFVDIGIGAILVIFYIVATVVVEERSRVWLSPSGREALAGWLGVRGWLVAHEVFADLPPASVAVWGRYLAYGAALDVVRAGGRTQ